MNLSVCVKLVPAVLVCVVVSAPAASAQATTADYQRAQGLREKYEALALNVPGPATWIEKTSRLWYRTSITGGHQFVVVDAATQQKRPAFDHEKLAAALSKLAGRAIKAASLPFNTITFKDDERALEVRFDAADWTCTLADYGCAAVSISSCATFRARHRRTGTRRRPNDRNSKPIVCVADLCPWSTSLTSTVCRGPAVFSPPTADTRR